MLLAVKSFEIFPKHNIFGFSPESFAFNWYIFVALTKKNSRFDYNSDITQIVFLIL